MKILQINKFYYRRRGAETYFLDLIDLLKQHDHEVAVLAMHHPQNEPSPWSKFFVSTVDYSSQNFKAARRVLWSTTAQQQLEKLLRHWQPDVAHVHNIYHQISPSILVTLKRHHIPIVQTLHDYKFICPNYELYTEGNVCERCSGHRYYNAVRHRCLKDSTALSSLAMMEMYFHKWLRVYEKNVDCFISPSRFLKNKIEDWAEAARRIEVLPNFIKTVNAAAGQADEPETTTSLPEKPYFFYAGAISEIKGVGLLLDNFQKNSYGVPLLLAGDGPQLQQYRTAIFSAKTKSNDIHFLGALSREQLHNYLSNALAILVPSRHFENFPYSVLEAFAHGKPVIGSNRGGIPELVNEDTGWLFEPNQPATLTAAIRTVLAKPEEVLRRGQAARQIVEQRFNPKFHYERLLEIYNSVVT